jgi:hypothetical protein
MYYRACGPRFVLQPPLKVTIVQRTAREHAAWRMEYDLPNCSRTFEALVLWDLHTVDRQMHAGAGAVQLLTVQYPRANIMTTARWGT